MIKDAVSSPHYYAKAYKEDAKQQLAQKLNCAFEEQCHAPQEIE